MASECGTIGAYTQHRRRNEEPCESCRLAWNAYQAEYRKTRLNPEVRLREAERQAARSRALHRLRRENPRRFHELYTEELAK